MPEPHGDLTSDPIDASGAGDTDLVAAVAGQRVRVYKLWFVCNDAVLVKLRSGTTDLHPVLDMAARGSFVLDYDGTPWFLTAPGEAFALNLGGAVQVSGRVYYRMGPNAVSHILNPGAAGAGGSAVPTSAGYLSLVDRVSVNSAAGGGGGSVTSAEAQAISAQAASALSQAVSVLAAAILVVSNAASAADLHASVASAAATSVDGRVNSVRDALSAAINVVSNAASNEASVRAASVQTASAAATSADGHANTVSAAVETLSAKVVSISAQIVSVDAHANTVSAAVETLSAKVVSISAQLTSIEAHAVAASAAATSVDARVNAASQLLSVLSTRVTSISAALTSLEVHASAASAAAALVDGRVTSLSAVLAGGLISQYLIKSSNTEHDFTWISVTPGTASVTSAEFASVLSGAGGAGSVTSAEFLCVLNISVLSQPSGSAVVGPQSALNVFSNMFSNAFSAGAVVSAAVTSINAEAASVKSVISAKLPWVRAEMRIVSNTQSNATSTLVDVSGMVLTVAAGELWRIDGRAMLSTSAVNAGIKAGFSVPPLSAPTGVIWGQAQLSTGGLAAARGGLQGAPAPVSGVATFLSQLSTPAGAVFPLEFGGIFNIASAGTIRLMVAGIVSAAASPLHVLAGTHMIAYRLR